jgi:hypothetical protein
MTLMVLVEDMSLITAIEDVLIDSLERKVSVTVKRCSARCAPRLRSPMVIRAMLVVVRGCWTARKASG